MEFDGIYSLYMTGAAGNGFGMLLFRQGIVAGADASGAIFNGSYKMNDTGTEMAIHFAVTLQPDMQLLQGSKVGSDGANYVLEFKLDEKKLAEPFFRVETPYGPVNAKLKKIRDIP